MIAFAVPVDPDADEARELLVRELAKPPYRAAEPTWFDRTVSAVLDWLGERLEGAVGAPPELLTLVIVLLVAGLIIAAYFIFGAPRANRRSTSAGALFGDDDARDAATLRAAAKAAAADGDYALAVEEMFRAIARGLSERAVLTNFPGTTATGFAVRASEFFPAQNDELAASARLFDEVRYLGRAGSEEAWMRIAALESTLRATTPRFETVDA